MVQDLEWAYLIVLALMLCVVGALLIWEPAYNKFKDWQLKRAFTRREKADKRRAGKT
jgi:di/tricarboxylate transporter